MPSNSDTGLKQVDRNKLTCITASPINNIPDWSAVEL